MHDTKEINRLRLGELDEEEIDRAVAKEVFGLSSEQIKAWPWGVPPCSTDRNYAGGLVCRMWLSDEHREAFEKNLHLGNFSKGVDDSRTKLLLMASPDELCIAAINAARECGPIAKL